MAVVIVKDLEKYPNEWVAIYEKEHRVVGHGKTLHEARVDAETKGFREVVFMLVPDPTFRYILFSP
jgi:hypothetical protein